MPTTEKALYKGMQKKEALTDLQAAPLKKKRGRKPNSPSPSSPPSGPLSFFKILIGDFKDVLFIPPLAVHILKSLNKKYVYLEDSDGNYWNVEMAMVDGSLAFQKGWHDFVADHSITGGEFVTFSYTGGLLFTVRIYGVCALERLEFQKKKRKARWANENCVTEPKIVIVQTPKKRKTSKALEVNNSPANSEVLKCLKRKTKAVKFSSSKVHAAESDPFSEIILEPANDYEKHVYDSSAKELKNVLHGSEQIKCINNDVKAEAVSMISPKVCTKSSKRMKYWMSRIEKGDADLPCNESLLSNPTAEANKRMKYWMSRIEKGAANLPCKEHFLSKPTAEVPDAMPKISTQASLVAHSDNEKKTVENRMKNIGKIEQEHSHDVEMIYSQPYDTKIDSLSNLERVEYSPVIDFELIELKSVPDKFFVTIEGKCYTTLDENLTEIATRTSYDKNGQEEPIYHNVPAAFESETSVPCESVSVVFSNPIIDCVNDKKEALMSVSDEYGTHQANDNSTVAESGIESCAKVYEIKHENSPEIVNGNDQHSSIAHAYFSDEERKDVTHCSRRNRGKIHVTKSAETPSSSCISFSICLSDDVQSSIKLPKKLNYLMGKLSYKRKVVVLQDPSMRCWPVLYHQNANFIGFTGGWLDFVQSNDICRGDVCQFEVVDKMELKFQVHITKAEIA